MKQSAALCLLRLFRTSPDSMTYAEWASRVIHLLNDQHMVCSYVCILSVLNCGHNTRWDFSVLAGFWVRVWFGVPVRLKVGLGW